MKCFDYIPQTFLEKHFSKNISRKTFSKTFFKNMLTTAPPPPPPPFIKKKTQLRGQLPSRPRARSRSPPANPRVHRRILRSDSNSPPLQSLLPRPPPPPHRNAPSPTQSTSTSAGSSPGSSWRCGFRRASGLSLGLDGGLTGIGRSMRLGG